jgi:amino acid transporter
MEVKNKIKSESYGESDMKLLVSLLAEYSDKLAEMCDKVENLKATENLVLIGMLICSIIFSMFFNLASSYSSKQPNSSSPTFTLVGIMVAVVIIFVLLLFKFFTDATKRRKWLRNIALLSKKLERVTSILSQLEDHSLGNISSRLEMDFRLTDAEQSLDRALALGIGQKVKGLYDE